MRPWQLIAELLTLSLALIRPASAQNFLGPADLCRAAEQSRVDSARFWTGSTLPAAWFRPCPIVLEAGTGSATGRTTFTISNGEVFGWRMTVAGERRAVLADVVPHEVDHMVRATLVRRPLPRWLDEGCAGLMESADAHQQLRRMLSDSAGISITRSFLDSQDYPSTGGDVTALYAGGFSLVEFLMEQGGPGKLMGLHRASGSTTGAIEQIYDLDIGELNRDWKQWRIDREQRGLDCRSVGCLRHSKASDHDAFCNCKNPPPNVLTVYTASWCLPCRRFWNDLATKSSFRDTLRARFHLHRVDVVVPAAAGVRSLPTFVTDTGRVEGYRGPEWLLAQLAQLQTPEPPAATAPAEPESTKSQNVAPSTPSADTQSEAPPEQQSEPPETPLEKDSSTQSNESPSRRGGVIEAITRAAPIGLSILEVLGIVGGTAATGGVGALAVAALLRLFRRRANRNAETTSVKEESAVVRAPFPRYLDEARELLGLRQSEGRVAALDALRGMFLEDELRKLTEAGDDTKTRVATQLMSAIDARVDEVAPLSTKPI